MDNFALARYLGTGLPQLTQTITISPRWKWISFYVNLSNKTLNDTFVENVVDETILIKAKDASANYFNDDDKWNPPNLDIYIHFINKIFKYSYII